MTYVWKNNIIEGLRTLSDYSFQKHALSNPQGPHMWIFVENYQDIFEDTGLLEALKEQKPIFNDAADHALVELYIAINQIDISLPDMTIVDLPAMNTVRQKASYALELISQ